MSEIHLNRRGINAIEVPQEVEAAAGSDLALRIVNHGSPLHITLASSNSSPFTGFFHENLYVGESEEFRIPIREDAYPGIFNVEVIAGYGAKKAQFRVVVRDRAAAPEPEAAGPVSAVPALPAITLPQLPPVAVLAPVAAGLVLYGLWLALRIDILNAAAFAALLIGVLLTWLRQRS
jgi:hypothetical protein